MFLAYSYWNFITEYRSGLLQQLDLDSDSNLWVAGDHTLTKIFTNPLLITDGPTISATPSAPAVKISFPASPSIDITLASPIVTATVGNCTTTVYDPLDNWNAGLVITRDVPNIIYVANSGSRGLVRFPSYPQTLCSCNCNASSNYLLGKDIRALW